MRIAGQLFGDDARHARRVCEILRREPRRSRAFCQRGTDDGTHLKYRPRNSQANYFASEINAREGESCKKRGSNWADLPVEPCDRIGFFWRLPRRDRSVGYRDAGADHGPDEGPATSARLRSSASVNAHFGGAPQGPPAIHE